MINPLVFHALADLGVLAFSCGMASAISLIVNRLMRGRIPKIDIKLPSGRVVQLEMDDHVSQELRGELLIAAVKAAAAGDETGVLRAQSDSHAASRRVREAAHS